ncbi:MAG: phosphatase PAP2 family protein [Bacteroidota bacterium]
MKAIFKSNLPFLVPYLIFILFGGLLITINTRAETHLSFNTFHNSFCDSLFYYLTFLGDGITALLVVIILLAVKFKYALIVGLSNIISALITQVLKHTVFSDALRPKKFFEGIQDLYLVPGVENHMYHSFPSGHATCAYSLYFALALIVKNKTYKVLFFILAFLAGYSRIYLSQHFFEDVYAGSFIGVAITMLVFILFRKAKTTG